MSLNGLKSNKRSKKVIVHHPTKGIFIGVLSGYAIFSKNDPMGNYEVYGFASLEKAKKFFRDNVPGMKDDVLYEEIESYSEYVNVIDIIKSKKTHLDIEDLFTNLPEYNEIPC